MSRNDDFFGCLSIVWILGVVFLAVVLTQKFGVWPWLIGAAGIFFLFQHGAETERERVKEQKRQLLVAPCHHGTVGGLRNVSLCTSCVQERQEADRRAQMEAQRAVAEQRQRAIEWRLQLRNHDFLRAMDPVDFEQLVLQLYQAIGYEVQATPVTNDQGIDGFLRRGNELVLLQCKRVKRSVGAPVLRDLYGNIKHHHHFQSAGNAVSGLLVTTGNVSRQGREFIVGKPIVIVEIDKLVELIDANLGINTVVPATHVSRATRIPRGTCPKCGGQLRRVSLRSGVFYGCSAYPSCRHTQRRL
jgi:hypothetical protein